MSTGILFSTEILYLQYYGVILLPDPRKLFDTTSGDDLMNASHDHDEDKYKRRPALQWFLTWFR